MLLAPLRRNNYFLAALITVIFLCAGIVTSHHYGISWDEPEHFLRGQGYLRLFLMGQDTYEGLVPYSLKQARNDPRYHQRSYYQHDSYNAKVWFINDKGHPPLNDIIAAFFNFIFYQTFGLVGDIEGYHLFNISISSVLIGTVFLFAAETFGVWAGIYAAIFLATYPLFWAESHFNIKDPAESVFIVLTLYFFWKAIQRRKSNFLLLSSLVAGCALAVKFNVLFLPFIVGPWLLLVIIKEKAVRKFIFSKKIILLLFAFPVIMFAILIAVWPFLWQDVVGNLLSVFSYYKELGTEEKFNLNPIHPWNFYPARWVLYTTPPVVIVSFLVGLFSLKHNWRDYQAVLILWTMLFLVTVGRVSFPNSSIYGGARQIMEYIPAMALIGGVGAQLFQQFVLQHVKRFFKLNVQLFNFLFVGIVLVTNIAILYRFHPNENVYFNFLVGGIRGAVAEGIPAAGNSYGNAYWQAVKWLNSHAQKDAKVSLIQGTTLNIPTIQLRPDIDFSNSYWSGINREGEYLVELTYQDKDKLYPYAWEYVDRLLNPVYEVTVDGVALAKIWKNDLEHTKSVFRKPEVQYSGTVQTIVEHNTLLIELPHSVVLTRMRLAYDASFACQKPKGRLFTSLDGINFKEEKDTFPTEQVAEKNPSKSSIYFYFPAQEAQFLKLTPEWENSCIFQNPRVELFILEK